MSTMATVSIMHSSPSHDSVDGSTISLVRLHGAPTALAPQSWR